MKSISITNGIWNAASNGVTAITGILGSVIIVHDLSTIEYGSFSYYMWMTHLLFVLGTLAFPASLTRVTSNLRGNGLHEQAEALIFLVVTCLVVLNLLFTIAMVCLAIYSSGVERYFYVIIAVVLVPNAIGAALRSSMWGGQRYKAVSLLVIVASIFHLVLVFVSRYMQWGSPGFFVAIHSLNIIQTVGLILVVLFSSGFNIKLDIVASLEKSVLFRYLSFSLPATLVLLFDLIVWQRSEIIFLQWFSDLEQVGFYNLAYTSYGVFFAVGLALVHSYYPAISHDHGAGKWDEIHKKVRQGIILATLFSVPISLGGLVTLHGLVSLLYGTKMLPSVPVAQVLFLGLMPSVIAGMLSITVQALDGIWLQVKLGCVLSVVTILLDFILVPRLGALGGSIANTAVQIIYSVLLVFLVYKRYGIRLPIATILAIAVIGLGSTLLLPVLLQNWVSGNTGTLVAIGVAGGIYAVTIWFMGYARKLI